MNRTSEEAIAKKMDIYELLTRLEELSALEYAARAIYNVETVDLKKRDEVLTIYSEAKNITRSEIRSRCEEEMVRARALIRALVENPEAMDEHIIKAREIYQRMEANKKRKEEKGEAK